MENHGTVLIVDDEPSIRAVCARMLAQAGYRIQEAGNGREAIEKAEADAPDLVLTDLFMPGELDGSGLLRELKERFRETDVVVMTAFPDMANALPALRAGVSDYIIKPFDQRALRSVVERCIGRRHLDAALEQERRQREELEASCERMRRSEALKDAFLSRVNHEMKTPISATLLSLECMEEDDDDGNQERYRTIIRARMTQLLYMVEDVLLLARFQRGEYPMRPDRTGLRDMLKTLIEEHRHFWEDKKLMVELAAGEDAGSLVADASLVKTACAHLFKNAVKFNKPGGRIWVRTARYGDEIHITVSDTGKGIPRSALQDIFASFHQAEDHLTREHGGMGIGLSLVWKVAQAHAGNVWADSKEGEGSTFTLSLPIKPRTRGEAHA